MKAVLINKAGFHKHIYVAKKVASFQQLHHDSAELRDIEDPIDVTSYLPIIQFLFHREYEDEWGETILIYKEDER